MYVMFFFFLHKIILHNAKKIMWKYTLDAFIIN